MDNFFNEKYAVINEHDPIINQAFIDFKNGFSQLDFVLTNVLTLENIEDLSKLALSISLRASPFGLVAWALGDTIFEIIEDFNAVYFNTASYTLLKLIHYYFVEKISLFARNSINYLVLQRQIF